MKHFIAFVTLGLAALGSGMALASHFSMPEPGPASAPTPDTASPAAPMSAVNLPRMPAMPRMPALPDGAVTMEGAERAFGQATSTMAYYSDRTFGPAAMKAKRSVEQVRMPGAR